jgi:rhomboid protease GluP
MSQPHPDSITGASPVAEAEGRAPITLLACAVAVVITFGIMAGPSAPDSEQMARWGYLPAERIWDGAFWALVTSAFVHLALWHLVFNVAWLWRLGGAVERALGSVKFVAFVLGAAFVGSACQLAVSGTTGIGASGIVYALFGLMWRGRHKIPRFDEILGADTASLIFFWLVACFIATRAGFVNIANGAHIAGLVFGILVAEWRFRGSRRRLAAGAIGTLLVLSCLAARANPWSERWLGYTAMKLHREHQYELAALAYERGLAFGADSAWVYHNLALTYFSLGDSTRGRDALVRLRAKAPAEADSLEQRLHRD